MRTSTMASSFATGFFTVFLVVDFLWYSQAYNDFGLYNTPPTASGSKDLEKRSIVTFPPDSVLQINAGITLASETGKNSGVIVLAFQHNSPLPKETLPSTVISARKFSIYDHLRHVLTSYGLNGSECLKKMICQISERPLLGGLVEDVIAFVLTPSRHRNLQHDGHQLEQWSYINSLLDSEELGKRGGNCSAAFSQCMKTPLDLVSGFLRV